MKDNILKLLDSPIQEDQIIGLILLKKECDTYYEMMYALNYVKNGRILQTLLLRTYTMDIPFKTKDL